jgi:hypothetical protein
MAAQYSEDLARYVWKYLKGKDEVPPSREVLTELLETLFFASLRHEESQPTLCRVALIDRNNPDPHPPEGTFSDRWKSFPLSKDLPLTVSNLVKLSQAVDPWGSTLAVDVDTNGNLQVWGLIDQSVHFSAFLVKEVSTGPEMPGMFQAVIEGIGEVSAYKNNVLLGTLKQDSLIINQHRVFLKGPIHSKMMPWLKTYQGRVSTVATVNVPLHDWGPQLEEIWFSTLSRLLIGIHRYRHGGAILISDSVEDLNPKYSIEYPRLGDCLVRVGMGEILKEYYSGESPPDRYTFEVVPSEGTKGAIATEELGHSVNELKGCLRFLTSLSRVDGLLWFDSTLALRGFGVEITLQKDPPDVFFARNSDGTRREPLVPNHFGMRHRSMLRYCGMHGDAIGFVISEDGDVRAVTKVDDAVLLWDRIRLQSVRTPKRTSGRDKHAPSLPVEGH